MMMQAMLYNVIGGGELGGEGGGDTPTIFHIVIFLRQKFSKKKNSVARSMEIGKFVQDREKHKIKFRSTENLEVRGQKAICF